MVDSRRFPIVGADLDIGAAAHLAATVGVGAVALRRLGGITLVPIRELPGVAGLPIGSVASSIGLELPFPPRLGSYSVRQIRGKSVLIDFGRSPRWNFGASVGYKVCSLNAKHQFTPTYPSGSCPYNDGGVLTLERL